MLPYGGITRIRFIGYDLNRRAAGTPANIIIPNYSFSLSFISYKRFQYLPVT